jgi:hypothetical protein
MTTPNPYEPPQSAGQPSPEFLAARARFRDRVMLLVTALGIFGSIMALVVCAALFRLFG